MKDAGPISPPKRRPCPWAILAVISMVAGVYLPVFLGGIVFTRDLSHWTLPARWFARESLLHGELPIWNPYQGIGFPVLADPLYGIFYPPNWLFLLLGPDWVASLVTWQNLAHLAWGSVGAFLLARRFKASTAGASIAALAWALSGCTTAQWSIGILLLAAAWLPWAAVGHLALLDSLHKPGAWWRGVVKAALPTAFALWLGEVFYAVMGVGLALVTAVVYGMRQGGVRWRRWLGAAALALMLASAAGAVVLLPIRATQASTERAAPLARSDAEMWSLHPARMMELVAPGSTGNQDEFRPSARWIADPRLDSLPFFFSVYLGAAAVALALAALGRKRKLAWALAGLAGGAVVLAQGRHLPVHGVFRRVALPMAYMRFPEKYLSLAVIWLCVLAGLGASRILSGQSQPWRRNAILTAALVTLALVAGSVFPDTWAVHVRAGALRGAAAVALVLMAQALARRRPRATSVLLVLTVACDLATEVWTLQSFCSRQLASAVPPAARLVRQGNPSAPAPPRIYRSNQVSVSVGRLAPPLPPGEGELPFLQTLITNTANVWGIATLPGYDAAISSRLNQIWTAGSQQGQAVLHLLGAVYTLLPMENLQNARPGLEPVSDPLPGARLYRVPDTLPRVFLAGHAEAVDDATALENILVPEVVAGERVLLAPGQGFVSADSGGAAGSCQLVSYGNRSLVATCATKKPALAVFVEQYDEGWQATVDDRPSPVLRANLIMRAVPLQPGVHTITMTYRARGLCAGALITVLALLALAVMALLPGMARRNSDRVLDTPTADH